MSKTMHVYIMASKRNGTLYVGVTSDLVSRGYQHREKLVPGFTSRYGVGILVHFERFEDPLTAIRREKRLKEWPRKWKLELIEKHNPDWDDLYPMICT